MLDFQQKKNLTLKCTQVKRMGPMHYKEEVEIDIKATSRPDNDCFMHIIDEVWFPYQSFSMLTKGNTDPTGFLTKSNHEDTDNDPEYNGGTLRVQVLNLQVPQ